MIVCGAGDCSAFIMQVDKGCVIIIIMSQLRRFVVCEDF